MVSDAPATLSIDDILAEARDRFGFEPDYEDQQLRALPEVLRGARRFIDVGANRGLYAYVANALLTDGEIVAIEANPDLAQALERAVATWPQAGRNRLRVLACAAGDREASLPFALGLEDTLGSFTRSDYAVTGTRTIEVPVLPLDRLVPPGSRTVIKIDVEGFEYRALLGAKAHLSQPDCVLVIELHAWGDAAIGRYPHHVLDLLRKEGFAARRFGEAHQFLTRRSGTAEAWSAFMISAPIFALKHLLRRLGVRSALHRLTGRSAEDALRARSGVRQ